MKKNTRLIIFYFFYFAAMAFTAPYIILYYQGLGFSTTQIGLLAGMAPLISMLGAPLLTGLADTWGRHKLAMNIATLIVIFLVIFFPLVKPFGAVLILVAIYSLFVAPISAFADSATMHMLGEEKGKYGRVRLGGTIGFGLASAVAGVIIQSFGIRWAFWGYGLIMLFPLIISQRFRFGRQIENMSLGRDIRQVLTNQRWIYFLCLAFIGGMAFVTINNYLFPYMESLSISRSMMGIALTIATIGELPVLFFAHHWLRRFGAFGLLKLGIAIMGVRILLYAWLNFTAGILFFQLLNGMTFPLIWVAGVAYADENSPAGMKATAQGLFGSMMLGLGASMGGLAGGLLFGNLGGQWMYLIFGSLALSSVVVVSLLDKAERTRQARSVV